MPSLTMTDLNPSQLGRAALALLRCKLILCAAILTLVAGCKETLYSELTETDANEMVALLVLSGVPASREKQAAGIGYAVMVEEADLAVAVTVLRNSGLPRERFETFGDVFGDVGVVGTPFEERVRFAHATNQELSHTITQIKGVDSARVHVVIPAEDRFKVAKTPARASIALFHDRSFEPSEYVARIKSLVAYAVPGLEIENISLTFFLSPGFVVEPILDPSAGSGSAMASNVSYLVSTAGDSQWTLPVVGITFVLLVMVILRLVKLAFTALYRFIFRSPSDA